MKIKTKLKSLEFAFYAETIVDGTDWWLFYILPAFKVCRNPAVGICFSVFFWCVGVNIMKVKE